MNILEIKLNSSGTVSVSQFCRLTAQLWGIVGNVIKIIFIIVPIIIVLMGIIDLSKAVMAGKEDEMKNAQKMLIKRLIYGVVVFMIFPIIKTVYGLIADGDNANIFSNVCWNCVFTPSNSYCKTVLTDVDKDRIRYCNVYVDASSSDKSACDSYISSIKNKKDNNTSTTTTKYNVYADINYISDGKSISKREGCEKEKDGGACFITLPSIKNSQYDWVGFCATNSNISKSKCYKPGEKISISKNVSYYYCHEKTLAGSPILTCDSGTSNNNDNTVDKNNTSSTRIVTIHDFKNGKTTKTPQKCTVKNNECEITLPEHAMPTGAYKQEYCIDSKKCYGVGSKIKVENDFHIFYCYTKEVVGTPTKLCADNFKK